MAGMSEVRVDMQVVDADGTEVGTVEEVKMGDPEAVTAQGQASEQHSGPLGLLVGAFDMDDTSLSDERRAGLLRLGYIKVDVKGAFKGDRYYSSDDIEQVVDDVVYLRTSGESHG